MYECRLSIVNISPKTGYIVMNANGDEESTNETITSKKTPSNNPGKMDKESCNEID